MEFRLEDGGESFEPEATKVTYDLNSPYIMVNTDDYSSFKRYF